MLYRTKKTKKINSNNNQPEKPIGDVIDLKTTSGTTAKQLTAKNIVQKYRNLARKRPYKRPPLVVE